MAEYNALRPLFTDIANAIRSKDGSSGTIPAETFPDRIKAIEVSTGTCPEDIFHIDLKSDPPDGGIVSGGGYASEGMECHAKAEAVDNHVFSGWKENNQIITFDDIYSFIVHKDRELAAVFTSTKYSAGIDWFIKKLFDSDLSTKSYFKHIAGSDGRFVILAERYDTSMTPYRILTNINNEDNWNVITFNSSSLSVHNVFCNNNDFYFAVYDTHNYYLYHRKFSDNAWSESFGMSYLCRAMAFSDTLWIAVGFSDNSTNKLNYGDVNGRIGTVTLPEDHYWVGAYYVHDKFVIIAGSFEYATVYYSYDCKQWFKASLPAKLSVVGTTYGNGILIISGANSILRSFDGINWEVINIVLPESVKALGLITFGNNKFVSMVTINSKKQAIYSYDCITWYLANMHDTPKYSYDDMAYNGKKFICIAAYDKTWDVCYSEAKDD